MNKDSGWIIGIGIVILIYMGFHINSLNKEVKALQTVVDECSDTVNQANDEITNLNSGIEDAKGNTWSDYDSMGNSLDTLEIGDNVDNPCYYEKQ